METFNNVFYSLAVVLFTVSTVLFYGLLISLFFNHESIKS